MKKNARIIGITAMIAVIGVSFTACGGGGGGGGGGGRAAPASDFSYDLTADGKGIKITGYTGNGGALVIPSTIEDMPVTEINEDWTHGFRGASEDDLPNNHDAITSLVIPDSIVVINSHAFRYIDELTKVTLPNTLKVIPESLFYQCPKLTSVNLPSSLETIDAWAFRGCGELSEVIIPESLTSVEWLPYSDYTPENGSFVGCGKLPIKTRQALQALGYKDSF